MRRTWVKMVCVILCVLALAAGAFLEYFALWVGLNESGNFYHSSLCWNVTTDYRNMVEHTLNISLLLERRGDEVDYDLYYSQQELEENLTALRAENTNFRFRVLDPEGKVCLSNVSDMETMAAQVYRVYPMEFDIWQSSAWPGGGSWEYYTCHYGVTTTLTADDGYMVARDQYTDWLGAVYPAAWLGGGCLVLGLVLLVLLIRVAGRRAGRDEAVRNLHDRIPYDLYFAAAAILFGLCVWFSAEAGYSWFRWQDTPDWVVLLLFLALLGAATLLVAFLLTTATRIKTRTIFRNTVIWRFCRMVGRWGRRLYSAGQRAVLTLPMVWRTVLLFVGYLLVSVIMAAIFIHNIIWYPWREFGIIFCFFLFLAFQAFVLWAACRWALQWRRIREATGAIVAGQTDVKIDTDKFYPDLLQHAGQLNDLGAAIDHAVEDRLKSERFKAELITNVSHDLKTPLTSIINYVDLLKKVDLQDGVAREYVEVLDRKSQRLKKLTEDLVEASKASTGTLAVVRERLDVVQLAEQAAGEYAERLSAAGLTLVKRLPEKPLYISADGRHLWRVLDNLLGNCAKYALEGTRVYLDAANWDGSMVLTVKNISRQSLNVPPEQLMERFVRGDESRTTEGSGLGLSIARSLTELQGGRFSLAIDGDLFKATVTFPLLKE